MLVGVGKYQQLFGVHVAKCWYMLLDIDLHALLGRISSIIDTCPVRKVWILLAVYGVTVAPLLTSGKRTMG